MVCAADKIHNLRSMRQSFVEQGDKLWEKFNAPIEKKLWFYEEVVKILEKRLPAGIMEELKKIMLMGKLKEAIIFMDETGLLPLILPEISDLKDVQQDERHHPEGDVFQHTLLVLDNAKPTVEAQMAALLHDVGKFDTQMEDEKGIHFYGHDDRGAKGSLDC